MAAKYSARRQKLKDVKAVWNNKETGEGEILKHTRPKPIDTKQPTESKIDSVTTKITSGSAAGARTSEGSTTGTAARGGGKAGSLWSAIANKADGSGSAWRNLNAPSTELCKTG